MNALIDVEVKKREWEFQNEIPVIEAEAARQRTDKILNQMPTAESILRAKEKLERDREKVEAAERAHEAGAARWNKTMTARETTQRHLADGESYYNTAKVAIEETKQTLAAWYYEGGHPQIGRGASIHHAIATASNGPAAQFLLDSYPAWREATEAKLAANGEELLAIAREFKLKDRLPAELQEKF